MIRRWFLTQLRRLAGRALGATAIKGEALGIPYAIDGTFADRASAIKVGLEGALGLIADFHPVRFSQVRRDLAFILVRPLAHRAEYLYDPPACVLEGRFVATFPQQAVAASIVRMATLARILKGPDEPDPKLMERASMISRRAEIYLGRRLPGGEAIVVRAQKLLGAPEVGLTRQEKLEIEFKNRIAEIDAAQLPQAVEDRLRRRVYRQYGYADPPDDEDVR